MCFFEQLYVSMCLCSFYAPHSLQGQCPKKKLCHRNRGSQQFSSREHLPAPGGREGSPPKTYKIHKVFQKFKISIQNCLFCWKFYGVQNCCRGVLWFIPKRKAPRCSKTQTSIQKTIAVFVLTCFCFDNYIAVLNCLELILLLHVLYSFIQFYLVFFFLIASSHF